MIIRRPLPATRAAEPVDGAAQADAPDPGPAARQAEAAADFPAGRVHLGQADLGRPDPSLEDLGPEVEEADFPAVPAGRVADFQAALAEAAASAVWPAFSPSAATPAA